MEDFIDYSAIAMLASLLVCIFFNGFLSMAETAIMEAHKTPLESLPGHRDRGLESWHGGHGVRK